MNLTRAFRVRAPHQPTDAGPDSQIGITEAGKAVLALVFCLAVAAVLVAAFLISS